MSAAPSSDLSMSSIGHAALVADDDAMVRDVPRSLLTEAGYTVMAAASGQEALALASYLDAAVAILDLAMPHGDGLQTCAALRRMANWRHVPILILTSYHTDAALRAARCAGVSGFVCKPFVSSELLRRIASLTGDRTAPRQHAQMVWKRRTLDRDPAEGAESGVPWERSNAMFSPSSNAILQAYRGAASMNCGASNNSDCENAAPEHRRILLAEDETTTREIVGHLLAQEGYQVDTAANGREALSAVIVGNYDLVLMDVRMPTLSGTEVTRLIRSLPNAKRHTPVIAMTANAFNLFAQEMQEAGMNGYLMKPVSAPALLDCVRQHLDGEAQPAEYDRQTGPARLLDLERLRDEARLFAPGAMGRFLDNLAISIEEILTRVQGWVSTEPAELRRRLHNMTGVAGTLGCTALSEVARDLEAEAAPSDALRQRFIATARASLAAIRQYRIA